MTNKETALAMTEPQSRWECRVEGCNWTYASWVLGTLDVTHRPNSYGKAHVAKAVWRSKWDQVAVDRKKVQALEAAIKEGS